MSNTWFHNPIPTKAQPSTNSQFAFLLGSPGSDANIPPLEELINDCFQNSMNQLSDPNRIRFVVSFENFIKNLHCQENLNFLIEIYKYEYCYEKFLPSESFENKERLNNTPSPNLSTYLNDSSRVTIYRRKSKTPSIKSVDHEPTSVFVSSFEDLDPTSMNWDTTNIWDNLRDRNVGEESDIESTIINEIDQEVLQEQWNYIINNYIKHDAPDQINLSNKLYNEILKENEEEDKIHNPLVLLKVKHEVFQLIKENVYIEFINKQKQANASIHDSPRKEMPNSPSSFNFDKEEPTVMSKSLSNVSSPVLSPTNSATRTKSQKKSRFVHVSTSSNNLNQVDSGSNNSSNSSLTTLLGHLKLYHSSSPGPSASSTNNPSHTDDKSHHSKFGKIWKSKKHHYDNNKISHEK